MSQHDPNRYPLGIDADKVRAILTHYESQTEDAAAAEDEAGFTDSETCIMAIPQDLVPQVQRLLEEHRSGRRAG